MKLDLSPVVSLYVVTLENFPCSMLGLGQVLRTEHGDLTQGLEAGPQGILAQPDLKGDLGLTKRQAELWQVVREGILDDLQRVAGKLLLKHFPPLLVSETTVLVLKCEYPLIELLLPLCRRFPRARFVVCECFMY